MRVTDGQTDRQNYDSQDRASIAASRGNKTDSSIIIGSMVTANLLYPCLTVLLVLIAVLRT